MTRARRSRRYGIVAVLMALGLGGFVTLAACSNGAEGERCQAENGNEDCQSGLVCLAAGLKPFNGGAPGSYVNPPFNGSDRCCPLDRLTATHPACVAPSAASTGGGSTDADTKAEADADASSDADTSPDADASSDADGD